MYVYTVSGGLAIGDSSGQGFAVRCGFRAQDFANECVEHFRDRRERLFEVVCRLNFRSAHQPHLDLVYSRVGKHLLQVRVAIRDVHGKTGYAPARQCAVELTGE